MAVYTHNATAVPSGLAWYNVIIDGDNPVGTPNATLLILPNSDGTETRIMGTGFTYDDQGETGGTVTQIQRTSSGGGTVYETITGLSLSLVELTEFEHLLGNGEIFAFIFGSTDTFNGFAGDDFFVGGPGGDAFNGGSGGTDTVSYDNALAAVRADLGTPGTNTGDAAGDTYTSIENLNGSDFNDTLVGNASDNFIYGGGGSNVLDGGDGSDILLGSSLADTLTGGLSEDALVGLGGTNAMAGGDGNDFYYSDSITDIITENPNQGNDLVVSRHDITLGSNVERVILQQAATSATGGADDNILFGVESANNLNLNGGGGNDTIYGSLQNDTLIGGLGDDALVGFSGINNMTGGGGNDFYYSDSGTDVITELAGGGSADRVLIRHGTATTMADEVEIAEILGAASQVTGNALGNVMFGFTSGNGLIINGAGGNDTITGSNQGDLITGGADNDQIFGAGGPDSFIFGAAHGTDTITDFVTTTEDALGHDVMNLVALGTNFGALVITNTAGGASINTGAGTIVLTGVLAADVTASDFIFV